MRRRRTSVRSCEGDGCGIPIVPYCQCRFNTMTRIVAVLTATLALTAASPTPPELRSISNSIFKIDISPEEAQQYLNSPPFTSPQLSAKTATLPLVRWDDPRFRSSESGPTNGHYWKNGREIENTNDYEEDVYDAQQFHGQDGLGAYAYGYKAPESSKVENRARSGDVTGSYEFIAGNNDIIKVRYWADSEGFHQEDNLPKDLPKPPEEPEDVRQARLAHEKAWQEAAAAAAQNPDPQGEYNPSSEQQYQSYQQYQQSASEQRNVLTAPSSSPSHFQREGKSYQNYQGPQQLYNQPQSSQSQDDPCSACNLQPVQNGAQGSPNDPCTLCTQQSLNTNNLQGQSGQQVEQSKQSQVQVQQLGHSSQQHGLEGQSSQQQPQYTLPQGQPGPQPGQSSQQQRQSRQQFQSGSQYQNPQQAHQKQQPEEPEPTGPPRGFFYSFNYPVSIITRKGGEQDFGHPGQHGQSGNQAQFGNIGRPSGQQPIDSDTVGINAQRP